MNKYKLDCISTVLIHITVRAHLVETTTLQAFHLRATSTSFIVHELNMTANNVLNEIFVSTENLTENLTQNY